MATDIRLLAKAKINLDLLITGKRADGYHLLDSLVVFADYGDEIIIRPAEELSLKISGPFAHALEGQVFQGQGDNLILKAAGLMKEKFSYPGGAQISLIKNLPVASGIGGGSADAAATIRGMIQLMDVEANLDDLKDLALSLGADVPVCLQSQNMQMSGIGDRLKPVKITEPLHLLLVNPGVSVSTAEIFQMRAAGNRGFSQIRNLPSKLDHMSQVLEIMRKSQNDLEVEACGLAPEIKNILTALRADENCLLARMSGSGATCFGLFENAQNAETACQRLKEEKPAWWLKSVSVK